MSARQHWCDCAQAPVFEGMCNGCDWPTRLDARDAAIEVECVPLDARDPDPSHEGFWRYHNCWKCREGEKPCPNGGHHRCDYPHARND